MGEASLQAEVRRPGGFLADHDVQKQTLKPVAVAKHFRGLVLGVAFLHHRFVGEVRDLVLADVVDEKTLRRADVGLIGIIVFRATVFLL